MAPAPLIIGSLTFATKGKATDHFRAMLGRYRPGDMVSGEDQAQLEALFERHPERAQKVGVGIASITVEAAQYGQQCFWITRIDDSRTDISYVWCIKGTAPSVKLGVMQAFREVVARDITIAKRMKFDELKSPDGKMPCPATGEALGWDDVHADHQQPMTFEVICETFLASREMAWEKVPLSSPADQQLTTAIPDVAIAEAFRTYHKSVAQIRLVSRHRNMHEGPKHRLRKNSSTRDAQIKL